MLKYGMLDAKVIIQPEKVYIPTNSSQRYYWKNREALKGRVHRYTTRIRSEEPAKYLWQIAKRRARDEGKEFTIKIEHIQIPSVCPVLQIPITIGAENRAPGLPSLDRINNAMGYTPENVRVISYRANSLKSNMTLQEAQLILADLEHIYD